MGRSRGGLTSKIYVVLNTNGLPMRLALTAGEAHDNRLAGKLLSRLKSENQCCSPTAAMMPTGSARKKRRPGPTFRREVIVTDPICFSPYLYRARNLVERFFNKIKQCRRVATRDDKLAANYQRPSSSLHQYGCGCALYEFLTPEESISEFHGPLPEVACVVSYWPDLPM